MTVLIAITILLAAVVASSMVARIAGGVAPLPLVQIAVGVAIGASVDLHIALDPELFLLLFIAPLLFLDGWRVPRESLFEEKWTISALAFGLVAFTVAGAGLFLHWLIPAMPLAVGFALAAVLSPTDAVAVSAIAARAPIPRRLLHLLEGEALLNDATGLVCFRFAIAAALTGTFQLGAATIAFVWLIVCGVLVGVGVTLLANAAKDWTASRFGEESGSHILISLLIPFAAYVLATHLGGSGILAAVAAGITMNYEERSGVAQPITRIRRAAVWDAVQFAANGVIFVLLGDQLPAIVAGAQRVVGDTGHRHAGWLILLALSIYGVLFILRALWVLISLHLTRRRHAATDALDWRAVAVMSLSGVRGALTLSGVMALPLALNDGSPFPARDLAILLAAGVIIVSLLAANLGIPLLVKGASVQAEPAHDEAEGGARLAAALAAMNAVETSLREAEPADEDAELYLRAGAEVVSIYRQRVETRQQVGGLPDVARKLGRIERRLQLIALRAERQEFYRLARSGKLTDEQAALLVREVDLLESRFAVA
ncbi:MAG: Na+/H+ antiporter [Caulobacter sp.]|nr:Na+/H+ antiporter [Caulobacter sp.]